MNRKLNVATAPKTATFQMRINPERKNIRDFVFEDFSLEGYDPHPTIKAPIAV